MPSIWAIIAIRICSKLDVCRECFFCVNKWHRESGKKPVPWFLHPGSLDYCFFKKTFQGIRVTMKYIFFFLFQLQQNGFVSESG